MPRFVPLASLSPAGWTVRVLCALAVCALGYAATTFSLAQVLARRNVALAYTLAPYDGRIAALRAASLAAPDATAADRNRADRFARTALRHDPTAVAAVSTLGIDAQVRGDTVAARRLMAYSQTLSRRDLPTQLWAIEDAVSRGDVGGALYHHDIALRTVPTMWQVLFPVLASAAGDPAVRVALVRKLADRPRWGDDFIHYIAVHGSDPRATVAVFSDLRTTGVGIPVDAGSKLVDLLVGRGLIDEAWRYYATIRPGADRRLSRDPRFSANLDVPSQLDWVPADDAGISASIQPDDRGGVFEFAASTGIGGPLLRQMQMLPPGNYRLEGHGAGSEQGAETRPYWLLSCRDGRELGRVELPASGQANGVFSGQLSVPAGCPVQMLVLVARPSDAVSGLSGRIDRVQLSPVR